MSGMDVDVYCAKKEPGGISHVYEMFSKKEP
jgi:hypothetical protein